MNGKPETTFRWQSSMQPVGLTRPPFATINFVVTMYCQASVFQVGLCCPVIQIGSAQLPQCHHSFVLTGAVHEDQEEVPHQIGQDIIRFVLWLVHEGGYGKGSQVANDSYLIKFQHIKSTTNPGIPFLILLVTSPFKIYQDLMTFS